MMGRGSPGPNSGPEQPAAARPWAARWRKARTWHDEDYRDYRDEDDGDDYDGNDDD